MGKDKELHCNVVTGQHNMASCIECGQPQPITESVQLPISCVSTTRHDVSLTRQ